MISLTDYIPVPNTANAEWIRLYNIYLCYREEALFWSQENKAYICLLDGDMTIYNISADVDELEEFIGVIAPKTIFSDAKTLEALGIKGYKKVSVMSRSAESSTEITGDTPNSKKVYEMFKKGGLSLPPYEYFAPDFCRRINLNYAGCIFGERAYAAYYIKSGSFALIQGVTALKKGMGSVGLRAVLAQNPNKTILACCEEELCEFYNKNGFERLYYAAFKERE